MRPVGSRVSGSKAWSRVAALLSGRRDTRVAFILLVVLVAINIVLNPVRFLPSAWGTEIGLAAPLVIAAIATMPVMLGGGGGIDVSVGPTMGLVNALLVQVLIVTLGIQSPLVLVAASLLIGICVGCINGLLATLARIQPIVATLGTYLLLSGMTLTILPSPVGNVPPWLKELAGTLSVLPLLGIVMTWLILKTTPFHGQLMAIGSDDRSCFTAGVSVGHVRFLSYVLTGLFGGVGGLALTALLGSADPTVGVNYTLVAISSVVLGGVSLAGGRGGLLAAMIGGLDIFLLQSVLTFFNISSFVLQIAYGLILVVSVSFNALMRRAA